MKFSGFVFSVLNKNNMLMHVQIQDTWVYFQECVVCAD